MQHQARATSNWRFLVNPILQESKILTRNLTDSSKFQIAQQTHANAPANQFKHAFGLTLVEHDNKHKNVHILFTHGGGSIPKAI